MNSWKYQCIDCKFNICLTNLPPFLISHLQNHQSSFSSHNLRVIQNVSLGCTFQIKICLSVLHISFVCLYKYNITHQVKVHILLLESPCPSFLSVTLFLSHLMRTNIYLMCELSFQKDVREDIHKGDRPLPGWFGPFFNQVIVLKRSIF